MASSRVRVGVAGETNNAVIRFQRDSDDDGSFDDIDLLAFALQGEIAVSPCKRIYKGEIVIPLVNRRRIYWFRSFTRQEVPSPLVNGDFKCLQGG